METQKISKLACTEIYGKLEGWKCQNIISQQQQHVTIPWVHGTSDMFLNEKEKKKKERKSKSYSKTRISQSFPKTSSSPSRQKTTCLSLKPLWLYQTLKTNQEDLRRRKASKMTRDQSFSLTSRLELGKSTDLSFVPASRRGESGTKALDRWGVNTQACLLLQGWEPRAHLWQICPHCYGKVDYMSGQALSHWEEKIPLKSMDLHLFTQP